MATGVALAGALVLLALLARPASAANQAVNVTGFAFAPATVNVNTGDTVTWTNNEGGGIPHTVTSDAGAFDSGQLQGGQTFSRTFAQAGSFAYHCEVHPGMKGTVVVAAAATTPGTGATSAPPAVGTGLDSSGSSSLPIVILLGATAAAIGAAATVVVVARNR